jgi:putative toxin-antitoxin system antitoxin component (TIGR02293 family)
LPSGKLPSIVRQVAGPKEKDALSEVENDADSAVRLLRIQTLADGTFGDKEKAHRWLRRPLVELLGAAPLDIAQTEFGAKTVETILSKIAWGAPT